MKLLSLVVRTSLLASAVFLSSSFFAPRASAQEQDAASDSSAPAKFLAAKRRAQQAASVTNTSSVSEKEGRARKNKDGADEIRKREEWFYKPRASANGHIPAGARARALQHMQRMMVREGKLVQRSDGSFAEVAPQLAGPTPLGAVTSTWGPIGPTPTTGGFFSPVTGRITAIAVDPSDTSGNTVLIGGAQGGIWRTTDAGTTWTPVGDQNASLAMGSIAFAPSSPTTVYAGTGEQASIGFDIYYGAGVLKSTDQGQTWASTCTFNATTCPFAAPTSDATTFGFFTSGGTRISYIAVNPSNPSMVLVAAQTQFAHGPTEGVYCSADGGATWNIVPTASGEMATFVGFASSTVAFAALGTPFNGATMNGVYKSTNANATSGTSCALTFAPVSGGLPASSAMGRIDLGISPQFATDNTVYASIANISTGSSNNLGVWVTTNGGTSWTQTTAPDICNAQCWYDNVVKVDPNGKNFAFFGGSAVSDASGNPGYVIRTSNGGTTWATAIPNLGGGSAGFPHVDVHAFAFAKLSTGKIRMYMGNDGGIWRTDDAEAATLPLTWINLNDSLLTLTQFYPALSVHPSSQGIAFAGAQDNGSQIYDQAVNGSVWTDSGECGDGSGTAIDNQIPSTLYIICNGNNIEVSTQVGQVGTYLSAVNGINPADNFNFVPPLVTDPSTANVVYTGTTKVYQSVNTGSSWTALSGDLVNGANSDSLISIAVAPTNSAVVYAGADTGQIFVATNVSAGTGTFNAVTGQTSLPPRQVNSIAVDPADSTGKTAYAAFSGFSFVQGTINDPKGHLFKTTDGGATWTDVSCTVANCSTPGANDLPNTPVNEVVIDPDTPNTGATTLYVGTDVGVFQGICSTTCTWTTLSSGLPRVAVLSLKLHHASRTLFAATHGRGTWTVQLNNFTFIGPHVSSISPVSAAAGSGQFTLTVNGNGLTAGTVQWNGSAVPTTFVSDSQLTATIAASLVSGAGVPKITVNVAATTSNALAFTVLGGPPTITNATPISAQVNAAATQITVTGTNFASNSVVVMNPDVGGTAFFTPTSATASQLVATIPAGFMAAFGSTNSVGVQNPPPGGGFTTSASNPVALPTFTVIASPPANDNFAGSINITSTPFTDTKDSSGATAQSSDPNLAAFSTCVPAGSGQSNTIWYKFVPTGSGTANIDTIGSSYDSVLSVWSGTSQTALTPVACNDDINPGIVIQSQLTNVPLTAGTTYYIMVSSFGALDPNPVAFGGKSVLNFSFSGTSGGGVSTTTALTSSSTNIASGGSITFTATVTGTGTGASPTGTVQFMNGSTVLGTAQTCTAVSGSTPKCTATLTTTLAFFAPPTGPNRIPKLRVPWFLLAGMALLMLFLLNLKRVPARYRRVYAGACLLLLAGLVAGLAAACNGGYGGGGGGVHYDSITAVYSGDSTYAGSTSAPPLQITIQ
jgi:hypothetical protein